MKRYERAHMLHLNAPFCLPKRNQRVHFLHGLRIHARALKIGRFRVFEL